MPATDYDKSLAWAQENDPDGLLDNYDSNLDAEDQMSDILDEVIEDKGSSYTPQECIDNAHTTYPNYDANPEPELDFLWGLWWLAYQKEVLKKEIA